MIRFCEKNLGKLLFPRLDPWKRQQKIRVVLVVVLIELLIAGAIVGLALLSNNRWK
jgi:hypothetical protein